MLNRNLQLFFVIASSILTLISTDIILPSLPHIAEDLAVSSQQVKTLLSIYMIGQFVTVLFWGVLADLLGKRKTLIIGMFLFFLGSIISMTATSITVLLACRFIQGAGAVVVPVAGWSLIQDLFPRDEGARIMSWVGMIVAVVPLFAPAIGGTLDVLYGWHINFYCTAAYASILCLLTLFLPKQDVLPRTNIISLKERLTIYNKMLRNKSFISYVALFGLLNCGEWCFLTVAPFYYDNKHLAPNQMGTLLMITSSGFVFGSMLASQLVKRIGVDQTIKTAIQLACLSSLLLLLGEYLDWDNQLFNALDLGAYMISSALLWGCTTSRALQCFEDYRASASAARSLIILCFSALGAYAGQLANHESLYHVGLFLLCMSFFTMRVYYNKELKADRLAQTS